MDEFPYNKEVRAFLRANLGTFLVYQAQKGAQPGSIITDFICAIVSNLIKATGHDYDNTRQAFKETLSHVLARYFDRMTKSTGTEEKLKYLTTGEPVTNAAAAAAVGNLKVLKEVAESDH
jgi:hypothetical protein